MPAALWLFGERDTLVPVEAAHALEAMLPEAEVLILRGAAHAPFLSSPARFLDLLFETVSAFATVGLSRGITPELTTPAKYLIALTMLMPTCTNCGRLPRIMFAIPPTVSPSTTVILSKSPPASASPEVKSPSRETPSSASVWSCGSSTVPITR